MHLSFCYTILFVSCVLLSFASALFLVSYTLLSFRYVLFYALFLDALCICSFYALFTCTICICSFYVLFLCTLFMRFLYLLFLRALFTRSSKSKNQKYLSNRRLKKHVIKDNQTKTANRSFKIKLDIKVVMPASDEDLIRLIVRKIGDILD